MLKYDSMLLTGIQGQAKRMIDKTINVNVFRSLNIYFRKPYIF